MRANSTIPISVMSGKMSGATDYTLFLLPVRRGRSLQAHIYFQFSSERFAIRTWSDLGHAFWKINERERRHTRGKYSTVCGQCFECDDGDGMETTM